MTTDYSPAPSWPTTEAAPPPQRPRRPGWVTTAGVILLTIAGLSWLIGLLVVVFAAFLGPAMTDLFASQPGMAGGVDVNAIGGLITGVMIAIGLITILWAAAHTVAGAWILKGSGWARIVGIVLSVIGLLFGLLGIVGTIASIPGTEAMMNDPAFRDLYVGMTADEVIMQSIISTVVFVLPFVIAYIVVVVALIRNGSYFDRG
jgi:hypothetical protein